MESRLCQHPERLFSLFLAIRNSSSGSCDDYNVLLKYPQNFDDARVISDVKRFSAPISVNSTSGEFFIFAFTASSNIFQFGYCLYEKTLDLCFCFLSDLPWFVAFKTILSHSFAAYGDNGDLKSLSDMLSVLYKVNAATDADITVTLNTVEMQLSARNPFKCLPDLPSDTDFAILSRLGYRRLSVLFEALMREKRIIFVAKRLGDISAGCFAALRILYPLCWQSVFIPILPPHLEHFLAAPCPFIVGILHFQWQRLKRQDEFKKMDIEASVVNLDDIADEDRYPFCGYQPYLAERLKLLWKKPGTVLAKCFLLSNADLLWNVDAFIRLQDDGLHGFDKKAFLESVPTQDSERTRAIVDTLLFNEFIERRAKSLFKLNTAKMASVVNTRTAVDAGMSDQRKQSPIETEFELAIATCKEKNKISHQPTSRMRKVINRQRWRSERNSKKIADLQDSCSLPAGNRRSTTPSLFSACQSEELTSSTSTRLNNNNNSKHLDAKKDDKFESEMDLSDLIETIRNMKM